MTLKSKYANTCRSCRKKIRVGDLIEWNKIEGAVHAACVVAPAPARPVPVIEKPKIEPKPKTKRMHPGDMARILQGVETETDIAALIYVAVDQKLPNDIRRLAGERLNDLNRHCEVTDYVTGLDDIDTLTKLSRTGMVHGMFQAFAKGRLLGLESRLAA